MRKALALFSDAIKCLDRRGFTSVDVRCVGLQHRLTAIAVLLDVCCEESNILIVDNIQSISVNIIYVR